jgi:N-carbamoyl-L-amino-acid hydrolase
VPTIDGERLIADLRALRGFGATGTGVVRPTFSPVDMEARRWLARRMAEAGLEATIDGVGNVIGRSRNPGPALLLGSHTDTQPRGGWLDGAYGVMAALEVARAAPDLAIDVASWADEEGTWWGFLGSSSFCGEDVEESPGLAEAIRAAGLAGVPKARLEEGRYLGYLEAHIEQGGVLEAEGERLGVVTQIVGMRDVDVTFAGQQNHAGTTPMRLRRDAGAAAIRFAHEAQTSLATVAGPASVWTIGRIAFDPGAPSIIPGRATLHLQVRDTAPDVLARMEAHVRALVAEADRRGPCRVTVAGDVDGVEPAAMDEGLQAHLAEACERHAPGLWRRMPSGAGHDAQVLARRLPAAMLFVPSIRGISHDFAEDTGEDDLVLGCRVLATAAAAILGR